MVRMESLILVVLVVLFALVGAATQLGSLGTDIRALATARTSDDAWRTLSGADFADFMAFCRREIPPTGSLVSIVAQPTYGYYRGNYELYPRTVWPIVSPLGPHAFDRPHVSGALLTLALRHTHARYLVVWHVALPHPLPAHRWVATFAPDEYVIALR